MLDESIYSKKTLKIFRKDLMIFSKTFFWITKIDIYTHYLKKSYGKKVRGLSLFAKLLKAASEV